MIYAFIFIENKALFAYSIYPHLLGKISTASIKGNIRGTVHLPHSGKQWVEHAKHLDRQRLRGM